MSRLRDAINDYHTKWRLADRVLLQMCEENPRHTDRAAVNSKLLLIGRGYATGLERKIVSTGAQASSLAQAAAHFAKHAQRIDDLIESLPADRTQLSADLLEPILQIHGSFNSILQKITRRNQSVKSFVSKYLHFHRPIVPIFDSFVERICTRLVRWNPRIAVIPYCESFEWNYYRYVMRFWQLYCTALNDVDTLTVKEFDYYLLCEADHAWTTVGS